MELAFTASNPGYQMRDEHDARLKRALRRVARAPSDEEAWRDIYDCMWPFVFAIAYRALDGRRTAAEDVAQDVFFRLLRYESLKKLRRPPDLRAYLRVATRHAVYDRLKKRASRQEIGSAPSLGSDRPSDSIEDRVELRDRLERAFRSVDSGDQDLLLCLASGWSIAKIAKRHGISYQNAAVRIHRLRKRLRG